MGFLLLNKDLSAILLVHINSDSRGNTYMKKLMLVMLPIVLHLDGAQHNIQSRNILATSFDGEFSYSNKESSWGDEWSDCSADNDESSSSDSDDEMRQEQCKAHRFSVLQKRIDELLKDYPEATMFDDESLAKRACDFLDTLSTEDAEAYTPLLLQLKNHCLGIKNMLTPERKKMGHNMMRFISPNICSFVNHPHIASLLPACFIDWKHIQQGHVISEECKEKMDPSRWKMRNCAGVYHVFNSAARRSDQAKTLFPAHMNEDLFKLIERKSTENNPDIVCVYGQLGLLALQNYTHPVLCEVCYKGEFKNMLFVSTVYPIFECSDFINNEEVRVPLIFEKGSDVRNEVLTLRLADVKEWAEDNLFEDEIRYVLPDGSLILDVSALVYKLLQDEHYREYEIKAVRGFYAKIAPGYIESKMITQLKEKPRPSSPAVAKLVSPPLTPVSGMKTVDSEFELNESRSSMSISPGSLPRSSTSLPRLPRLTGFVSRSTTPGSKFFDLNDISSSKTPPPHPVCEEAAAAPHD